jgi:hypothetical protein
MIRSAGLKYKPKSKALELSKFETVLNAEYEIVGTLLDKERLLKILSGC